MIDLCIHHVKVGERHPISGQLVTGDALASFAQKLKSGPYYMDVTDRGRYLVEDAWVRRGRLMVRLRKDPDAPGEPVLNLLGGV